MVTKSRLLKNTLVMNIKPKERIAIWNNWTKTNNRSKHHVIPSLNRPEFKKFITYTLCVLGIS